MSNWFKRQIAILREVMKKRETLQKNRDLPEAFWPQNPPPSNDKRGKYRKYAKKKKKKQMSKNTREVYQKRKYLIVQCYLFFTDTLS